MAFMDWWKSGMVAKPTPTTPASSTPGQTQTPTDFKSIFGGNLGNLGKAKLGTDTWVSLFNMLPDAVKYSGFVNRMNDMSTWGSSPYGYDFERS